ncbi:MAG: dephospho-CoA kinase [Alphaproteobacteria bacterium]|nr:dephospho-CoA kinase [Alphaproteobacteria bacterium]
MLIVGLTGSIGMGKSTATKLLRQMGVPVYDADAAVHAVQGPGGEALPPIEAAFPGSVRNGVLDRAALGAKVFADPAALRRLEVIVHPLVNARQRAFLKRHAARRTPIVVLDIPLLFEGNGHRRVDATLVVSAPGFLQKRRVLARPGMTEAKFLDIVRRQVPDTVKRRLADFVIPSNAGIAPTRHALAAALRQLSRRRGAAWPPRPWRERWTAQLARQRRR